MKKLSAILLSLSFVFCTSISDRTRDMKHMDGFYDLYWDDSTGSIYLEISRFNEEFLYVNSLTAGLGSNDVGLDRNQLGSSRVVYFHRVGPKVLLIQPNYKYRAQTENLNEIKAVEDGFAKSVLWGFEVVEMEQGRVLVNATDFFLNDAHNIVAILKRKKMGDYKLDKSRSVIHLPATMAFPKNTEVEALTTYTGSNPGSYVRQVTPTPEAITVRQHHSFVELPDGQYEPRRHDPRAGYFSYEFRDYAAPLDEPIQKRFIYRHRLEKKNPAAMISEPIEPIIYYIDPGVPEPVKTAMLESAGWWDEAFQAAGYTQAFQVRVLPENAHPMDVRYNMIHWVHRATRGWSYGSLVEDPRTGEIIKGNVSLGSLRLRQDYLIATGLLAPYKNKSFVPDYMREIALARVRQLVAHEIGHTIGLAHNYIASTANRSSVMDYPFPAFSLDNDGNIEWRNAYSTGIGEWDKLTIAYGYQDFPEGTDENKALEAIIQNGIRRGYIFISDRDARPLGSAHPKAHLWDNGKDPVSELKNILAIRKKALENFGQNNIRLGQPFSDLGDILVPIYFYHRFQIEGTAKVVGGLEYSYALRGDGQKVTEFLDPQLQMDALDGLIESIKPEALTLREDLLRLIPPRAFGHGPTRESFQSRTGVTFDGISLAETAAQLTCRLIFHTERAARLVEFKARNEEQPGLGKVLKRVIDGTILQSAPPGLAGEVKRNVDFVVLDHLLSINNNKNSSPAVKSITMDEILILKIQLDALAGTSVKRVPKGSTSLVRFRNARAQIDALQKKTKSPRDQSHFRSLHLRINQFLEDPEEFAPSVIPEAPPGSPIGGAYDCTFDNFKN